MIDIIIIFNTGFYNDDYKLITCRKTIAKTYLKSWFLLDIIAIVPIKWLMDEGGNFNGIARISRLGRLYKLLKFVKMVRILTIVKNRN